MLSANISDIATINVKYVDYLCSIVVFITLVNLKQLGYQKVLCLKIVAIYKQLFLKFQSILYFQFINIYFFFFTSSVSIYKMVDSMGIYKSLNINIRTVIKNPEMLKFVPDHLKTKKMWKHAVNKLPYLSR